MKSSFRFLAALVLVSLAVASCQRASYSGPIKVKVPQRPAGQEDVLNLVTPPMDTVRIGIVGIGSRGSGAVARLTYVPGCRIAAICDVEKENVDAAQKILSGRGYSEVPAYYGDTLAFRKLCERDDIDLVYICTDWIHHTPVALYAMEHGKNAAIEVPAATNLEEIWALINTSERTRLHCMMLENCCYDFFELSTLNMAQKGAFGEILHVEGSYLHYLGSYWDGYWHNWRLDFNQKHDGDIYPTHGLGPICQVLNIHRGDRMKTLVAMDTKSANGYKYAEAQSGKPVDNFINGDETSTLIRTELGKTILVEHDVMTPRPYDRMYQVVGTDGFAEKYPVERYCFRQELIEGREIDYAHLGGEKTLVGEEKNALMEKYRSPILTPELEALAKEVGGHGGMDFIMDYRLIYCLRNGLPLDMDVYDLAEWCCLGELGSISIANGNAPVEVPDFTRGAWNRLDGFSYAFAK